MALPLSINNPQTQESEPISSATTGAVTTTFGGNAIGGGSASTDTSAAVAPSVSTILIYGVIGLGFVWLLQRID